MRYFIALVTLLMLTGCVENRLVYERVPMVPLPDVPTMAANDNTAATWEANYVKAATFGSQAYLGIREHASIAIERNVARGLMTHTEGEVAWKEYRLPGVLAPIEDLQKKYPIPPEVTK